MIQTLLGLDVPKDLCLWILDFLTDRKQMVRVDSSLSSLRTLNTGAPQGCVLSPVLFILYTNSFCASEAGCHILKYADDTVVLGAISDSDEYGYRQEICNVIEWCAENHLVLNASKTKEIVFDFRQRPLCQYPVFINSESVELVDQYKYLGVIIDDKLRWEENTDKLYKKGQQRLYYLRKLKYFHMDTELLRLFYTSIVQSAITFGIVCWWSCLSVKNKIKLNRVKRAAERLTGLELDKLEGLHLTRSLAKMKEIMKGDNSLSDKVVWLRSGRRLQTVMCRTSRFRNSFLPCAIRLFNEHCNL